MAKETQAWVVDLVNGGGLDIRNGQNVNFFQKYKLDEIIVQKNSKRKNIYHCHIDVFFTFLWLKVTML